jgi:uncharacterized protein (TIGR00730 family)
MKESQDDPEAPERVRRILENPSYVRADQDIHFLERSELRPSRLAFDYLKAELILREHGIQSTIVLFGGTRIVEPAAARRRLERSREAVERQPDSAVARREARVAERVVAKSRYYDIAREFGRLVSRECPVENGRRCAVVTGGGPGIMEAGNRGADDVGAKSVGLNITLPLEQYPNPYITPELCFQFRYFAMRKLHFMKRARAMIAFPGGYGTLDELFDTLTLVQTRKIRPVPVVLVGREFWTRAFDAEFLAEEGVIDPEDTGLFAFAETAEEIWSHILAWYRERGLDPFARIPE